MQRVRLILQPRVRVRLKIEKPKRERIKLRSCPCGLVADTGEKFCHACHANQKKAAESAHQAALDRLQELNRYPGTGSIAQRDPDVDEFFNIKPKKVRVRITDVAQSLFSEGG